MLHGRDDRLMAIIGPCSFIHDPKAAHEYAVRLAAVKKELDRLVIVMRVEFREAAHHDRWKGLINDPILTASSIFGQGHVHGSAAYRRAELGLRRYGMA